MSGEVEDLPLRTSYIADEPCLARSLLPPLPADSPLSRLVLVRRCGAEGFGMASEGTPVGRGDTVVVYQLHRDRPEQIEEANRMFSARYYADEDTGVRADAWPDEVRLAERFVPGGTARVLEVCCGGGRATPALQREDNRVWGVDISSRCIARARRNAQRNVEYFLGDATSLPFADRTFDCTLLLENSLGVFFAQQADVLAELIRVCVPGGRVLLGLREFPGSSIPVHVYNSKDGYVEFAQTFPRERAKRIIEGARRRVTGLTTEAVIPGTPRPWGGRLFYVVLRRT